MAVAFATEISRQDGLVYFTYEGGSAEEAEYDATRDRAAGIARDRKEFAGKRKQVLHHISSTGARHALVIGLGPKKDASIPLLREMAAHAARTLQDAGARHIALIVPQDLDASLAAQAVTEGAVLGTYRFTQYKTDTQEIKRADSITIISDRTGMAARQGFETGRHIAESCILVRDLQNTPPADLTPDLLAQRAAAMAKEERISCRILDKRALEKGKYGGILAVGGGSANEPRLVTLEYAPKGAKRTVAVVGKGITFDTGGLNLKPSEHMLGMKYDMSGAAAVIGIVRNASRLKLPVHVYGVLGVAENSVSGTSYRPDDVVRTLSGKTIEIQNTDAEGRVVLADALYHASTLKPDVIIDLATLTGAVGVALGDVAAGVLGNDQGVIDTLVSSGKRSGELLWQLPLWEQYERDIESKIADMKNMPVARLGGTIVGAMLLKQFVQDIPWAHLDIANVSWAEPRDIYLVRNGEGGTAFGVRLVTEFLRSS